MEASLSTGQDAENDDKKEKKVSGVKRKLEFPLSNTNNDSPVMAIWAEDIILEPGNVRFPIRVVLVDSRLRTRFDRLVQLPKNTTTHIYRVLDHGIPWQHLQSGLLLEDVKKNILELTKGKRVVLYDAWKTIGLFGFSEQQLSRLRIYDLKTAGRSQRPDGRPMSFWELVRAKLGYTYSGKPGNYDTIELTDFVMRIFIRYKREAEADCAKRNPELYARLRGLPSAPATTPNPSSS